MKLDIETLHSLLFYHFIDDQFVDRERLYESVETILEHIRQIDYLSVEEMPPAIGFRLEGPS